MDDFIFATLRYGTPLVYVTLAGVLAQRAGVWNLGLEGLMIVGCCGVAFSMFGRFVEHAAGNATLRIATAALACIALFHPDDSVGWAAAALVLPLTLFGVWRHRRLVSAKDTFESQPAT